MIKIVSFVYCNGIEPAPEGPAIRGVLQFLAPKMFPTEYTFSVSMGLFDVAGEETLNIRYVFKNSQNKILHDTGEVQLPVREDFKEKKHLGVQLNLDLKNVVLEEEGEYSSEVYINGKLGGTYPISVVLSEKNE